MSTKTLSRCLLFAFGAVLMAACVERVDPPSTPARPGAADGASGGSSASDKPYSPPEALPPELPARTWRLSHAELAAAVQAFLGVTIDVTELEPEIDNGVYPNMSASGLVRVTLARGYQRNAEAVSDALHDDQLAAFVPGMPLDAAAKSAFVRVAVERAFRRPASAEEIAAYEEIFDLGASAGEATLGFRSVLRGLLVSPFFLYRTEIGSDPNASHFTLTDYEIASLLSFSLLGEPPSGAIVAAAARGELTHQATLAEHVKSLLDSNGASARLNRFMFEWLGLHHAATLDKDAALFPDFPSVRPLMLEEASDFLSASAEMDRSFADLFVTPNAPSRVLSEFYSSEPSSGGSLGERRGVLSLGAVAAARAKSNSTSPTLRGHFVRERFLCQTVHLPAEQPPDLSETEQRDMPRTTRELYERHTADATCAGCHDLLDPIGFTFEDLDAAGRFRTTENGYPIDTTGMFETSDVSSTLANRRDLSNALVRSEWARECLATQAFRFYFGQLEAGRGVPAIQAGRHALGTGTFRELLVSLLGSESTTLRVRN